MIQYSQKFIEQVKQVLPDKTEIHKAIANGSSKVGEFLYQEVKAIMNTHRAWTEEMTLHFQQNS